MLKDLRYEMTQSYKNKTEQWFHLFKSYGYLDASGLGNPPNVAPKEWNIEPKASK